MLLPFIASAFILFGSPYVGQLRSSLRASFPDQYPWIIGGVTAAAAVAAIGWAIARLRQSHRDSSAARLPLWARYALIITAVVISAGYARAVTTGNVEVDLVEAFHFVEYGFLAYLLYLPMHRSWAGFRGARDPSPRIRRPDVSGVALAACAGLAVGIADEWVQWFVPGRVGEMHDILLNAVAIGCGLMISMAVRPPSSLALPARGASRLTLGAAASGLLLAFAGFVDCVHLGYELHDGRTAVFRSAYDAHALETAAANRAERWAVSPPPVGGFHREDHYLSEGEWHVQRRTLAIGARDWWIALRENAILEHFYAPVLEMRDRLSEKQRLEFARNADSLAQPSYVSDAAPYPIYVISRPVFWTITFLLAASVLWLASRA